jgi:hypothetical protein
MAKKPRSTRKRTLADRTSFTFAANVRRLGSKRRGAKGGGS